MCEDTQNRFAERHTFVERESQDTIDIGRN